jgi:molybdate transport system regulatory protein
MMKKEIHVRCWVDIDGVKHFGTGRAELLELILETGSIATAARKMGMSYKKAWDMVEKMNERGQKPYVITHKGGSRGGGTEVTDTGKNVLASYKKLIRTVNKTIKKNSELLQLI